MSPIGENGSRQIRLEQGEEFFSKGMTKEAEQCFLALLEENPSDANALNNLGVVKHSQGDDQDAEELFLRALKAQSDHLDTLVNLVDLYQKTKRWEEAAYRLEECVAVDGTNPDLYNQLGRVYLETGNTEKAQQVLAKSLKLSPNQGIVRESFSELQERNEGSKEVNLPVGQHIVSAHQAALSKNGRKKIAVLCLPGLESFLKDIVVFLKTKYEVRTCFSKTGQEIESAIRWADIVWLEWANELAIHVTTTLPLAGNKYVICRVHSYEVLQGFLPQIDWSKIDKTIFVANHVLELAADIHSPITELTKCHIVNNGVNLDEFGFKERKPGFNIGVVGGINYKKNPSLWPEIMTRLKGIDNRYTLKVAGQCQDFRYKHYMESLIPRLELTKQIQFFGEVQDIRQWFQENDINYLLCTSLFESFGYSIGEAMAMGYRPLIHAFPGAEKMWPQDCLFGCIDELIELLQDGENYNSQNYRRFVEENYSLQSQLFQIEGLLKNTGCEASEEGNTSEYQDRTNKQKPRRSHLPVEVSKHDMPERNLIVTGIPRSGTSLFSSLLNKLDNVVCLNEMLYDVNTLPRDFLQIRRRLIAGEPIPNRYDISGNLATDTQNDGIEVVSKVSSTVDENVIVGSKVNIPYLNQIRKILDYGYRVIAIVRDPVYVIGSWNSGKASSIPEAHVIDGDMHPRWRGFKFTSDDKIDRQAQIWNAYAQLIWSLRDKLKIYTYELITSDLDWVIGDLCRVLGVGVKPLKELNELKSQNIDSKYTQIERIRETVKKYCPIKDVFGYNYLDYQEPLEFKKCCDRSSKKCGISSKTEQTDWSQDINYSRRAILSEKGVDPSHLIIAFGGIANQLYLPPFEFFRATKSLTYSRILVRDFKQGWYHLGIDEELTSFDVVHKKLESLIKDLEPTTICTVGTSAGGYAALAFGHLLEVDYVHVLAPQTFIDPENRRKIGDKRWENELEQLYHKEPSSRLFYDLRRLLEKPNRKTIYNVHVCKNHRLDMAHGEHIKDLPEVRIKTYPCNAHNVAQYLRESHTLTKLLEKPVSCETKVCMPKINGKRVKTGECRGEPLPNAASLLARKDRKNRCEEFESIEKYCMFVGYPRSGHSVIGSVLDAHPNIVLGHEVDALGFVKQGLSKEDLYQLIVENSKDFTAAGRTWTGYSYEVPNQWHGRYDSLKVIGDKKGGRSSWHLRSNPDLLRELRQVVGVDVKIIHVIRHPLDNISTIFNKEPQKGLDHAIDFYFEMAEIVAAVRGTVEEKDFHEVHLESFIENPRGELKRLCGFLSVVSPESYLEDSASIIFSSPRKTRKTVNWTSALIRRVQDRSLKYPFISHYCYEI